MAHSAKIYEVYLKYVAPDDIHSYSIDGVFIDATHYLSSFHISAHDFVMQIILDVLKTTGITTTAGVGPNLYLSKVAMDVWAKYAPADENGGPAGAGAGGQRACDKTAGTDSQLRHRKPRRREQKKKLQGRSNNRPLRQKDPKARARHGQSAPLQQTDHGAGHLYPMNERQTAHMLLWTEPSKSWMSTPEWLKCQAERKFQSTRYMK